MTDDANQAYNRNRYQSSLLQSTESDIRYGSLPAKAVAPGSYSTTTPVQTETSSKATYFSSARAETGFSNGTSRSTPMGFYGNDLSSIDITLSNLRGRLDGLLSDHVAVVRMASHLSILMIAVALLIFSQIKMPKFELSLANLSNNITNATLAQIQPTVTTTSDTQALIAANPQSDGTFDLALPRMVVPFIQSQLIQSQLIQAQAKVVAETPAQIRTYNVQPGDTIFGIAQRLGLNPESLQWANPALETNPDMLSIGDQLKIPPMDGVLHSVRSGDSLNAIAQRYKVSLEAIVGYAGNHLADTNSPLVLNQDLFVPGGVKAFEAPAQIATTSRASGQVPYNALKGSGDFAWPSTGQITQYYWRGHPAIDVASWAGNPVKSADSGYVVEVVGGWSSGYGLHVIVDHGNGFQTLYAHLSSAWVSVGENVSKGQQIGAVGSSGNSTGPHLHFEVRYQGAAQNPISYLR